MVAQSLLPFPSKSPVVTTGFQPFDFAQAAASVGTAVARQSGKAREISAVHCEGSDAGADKADPATQLKNKGMVSARNVDT